MPNITRLDPEEHAEQQRQDCIRAGKNVELAKEIYGRINWELRDPRSTAYKVGVLRGIQMRLEVPHLGSEHPYRLGTAQSDAFWSGTDEGKRRVDNWLHPDPVIQKLAQ